MIKEGDIVWAKHHNRLMDFNPLYQQPFRVFGIRKQATGDILLLRGLWHPNITHAGDSPNNYVVVG